MQVILAMVVVAFVGMYMRPQGQKSGIVATVNGVRIMDTQYGRAYRSQLATEERRQNRTLSDAEQKSMGEQVKQQLIRRELLLQEAARLGLHVSDEEVARQVMEIPGLADKEGRFSREEYQRFLKRQQFTQAEFEERLREDLLASKLAGLATIGASLSEPALREAYVDRETQVTVKMVELRPSLFEDKVTITDEDRASWLEQNSELVGETYERDFDRLYNHPEKVRLSLIRLAVLRDGPSLADLVPKLNAVRESVVEGKDFADMARRWSEDPSALNGGDLGLRPIMQLSLPASEAIEGLAVGEMSKVFTTDSDVRLVRVEEREEPRVDTLEDVTDAIADRLIRSERVPEMAASFAQDELLAGWQTAGEAPEELLQANGLVATDLGPISTISSGGPFGPPQSVLDAARTAEVGSVLPEVFEERGTLYVAQLVERVDADMEKFEEDKETLRETLLANRRNEFFEEWVADLRARATIQ
ncbi:MAG: SurA N-terminal domain-containing protein [Myxococcales bacterium]|nr:SurA N-terminal domain-containing protein [Myxococcales bacterium]